MNTDNTEKVAITFKVDPADLDILMILYKAIEYSNSSDDEDDYIFLCDLPVLLGWIQSLLADLDKSSVRLLMSSFTDRGKKFIRKFILISDDEIDENNQEESSISKIDTIGEAVELLENGDEKIAKTQEMGYWEQKQNIHHIHPIAIPFRIDDDNKIRCTHCGEENGHKDDCKYVDACKELSLTPMMKP